jgi:hypothetical protein
MAGGLFSISHQRQCPSVLAGMFLPEWCPVALSLERRSVRASRSHIRDDSHLLAPAGR